MWLVLIKRRGQAIQTIPAGSKTEAQTILQRQKGEDLEAAVIKEDK